MGVTASQAGMLNFQVTEWQMEVADTRDQSEIWFLALPGEIICYRRLKQISADKNTGVDPF